MPNCQKRKNKKKLIVVAVSGYFNPLHIGHLEMIEKAKKLGDKLVAIVNSDYQVKLKGSVSFMPEKDRLRIISALRDVDEVFLSIDKDKTVCRSLVKVCPDIFANGGDRKNINDVPEFFVCQELGIRMVDGLGKKIRASSEMIARASALKAKKNKIKNNCLTK
jgi:cytidyltransferase-like protein